MVDHDLLFRELTRFASTLTDDFDLAEALQQISASAAAALGLEGAGITLYMPGGTSHYVTATDPVTMHVERKQEELQEGACVDAMSSAQVVAVDDLNTEARWPAFRPFVLEAGFSAVAGVPVRFHRQILGAVNLYGREARSWTTEELGAGQLVADLATGYLVNSSLRRDAEGLAVQLQQALDSRVAIEQAKGVLAGRYGIDPEVRFAVLRQFARSNRMKLQDVARGIIDGSVDPVAEERATRTGDAPA